MMYEKMKDIRTYYDDSQSKVAKHLKVSRSTYAGWENAIDSIPLIKLIEFCNFYNVSLDYICGLSNKNNYKIVNNTINKELLCKNLRMVRTSHNDSQKKIAEIIKVDQSNYSKYEIGKILITTYPLIEFAKYYNVSIDWLCGKIDKQD